MSLIMITRPLVRTNSSFTIDICLASYSQEAAGANVNNEDVTSIFNVDKKVDVMPYIARLHIKSRSESQRFRQHPRGRCL